MVPGSCATARRPSPRWARQEQGHQGLRPGRQDRRGGLIEVPMGITLREIVEDVGGGVAGGRQLQGGAGRRALRRLRAGRAGGHADRLRGALPPSGRDHGLRRAGRAGRHRLHGRHRPLFPAFTQDQSCGKCTFCRVGTRRMLDILDRLCDGPGAKGDLELLEHCRGRRCGQPVRPGQDRAQSGAVDAALFPRRVRGAPRRAAARPAAARR
jgi:hypothetical protein